MYSNTDIYFAFPEANNPKFSSPFRWTRHNTQNHNRSPPYYLHSGLFHLRIICKNMDIFQRASRFFWWRIRPPKTFQRHNRHGDAGKSVPTATVRNVNRSQNVKMTLQLCSYEGQGSYILMGENGHMRNTNLMLDEYRPLTSNYLTLWEYKHTKNSRFHN